MEDTYQDGWLKPKDIKITANINGKKKFNEDKRFSNLMLIKK